MASGALPNQRMGAVYQGAFFLSPAIRSSSPPSAPCSSEEQEQPQQGHDAFLPPGTPSGIRI